MMYSEDIQSLKGIGEKTARLFHKLGIDTVWELLNYYPRDYQSFLPPVGLSAAKEEETVALRLTLAADFKWRHVKNLSIGTGKGFDETDEISLTYFNVPYLKKKLTAGSCYIFRGKLKREHGKYHMDQPQLYTEADYQEKMAQLWPCYGLTAGLSNHTVTKAVQQAFAFFEEKEFLPQFLLEEYGLISKEKALWQIHFPTDQVSLIEARRRLVFEEFLLFLLFIRQRKEDCEAVSSDYPMLEHAWTGRLIESLPYRLTKAQEKVWKEIQADMVKGVCMNRLVQGDVGSGKTILAFLALLLTAANGYQGALMAPTEILAEQHFGELAALTDKYGLPIRPVLLTGSTTASGKREIYRQIESGEVNVVIGTHALIQEKVSYQKLALVITDEQHRFGVRQRELLGEKGGQPHVLVMSATPIPRTLAIILYGDLHLSLLDELPADRLPIKNCVVGPDYRSKAYQFIINQVRSGRQAYVICPMVETGGQAADGDMGESLSRMDKLENVADYTAKLKEAMPGDICVEMLHGRMKGAEKKRIMDAFAAGNIHVLVSTTVIEVGINVPNATVMMIENAERFGLAQLHQLRGRIGRGQWQSYCIFLNTSDTEHARERLSILNHSNDGFFIAQEDLKLRGPGDLFGIRQSGAMEFRIADIYQDADLLQRVSMTVEQLLGEGLLEEEQCAALRQYLRENEGNFIDFRSI